MTLRNSLIVRLPLSRVVFKKEEVCHMRHSMQGLQTTWESYPLIHSTDTLDEGFIDLQQPDI